MDKCTILVENTNSELKSAKTEHGLSLLIEAQNQKFLFDFGSSNKFINNSKIMNKKLDDLNFVAISHSHYDHASGFLEYLNEYKVNELVIGNNFFLPKYALNDKVLTYLGCGFDSNIIDENAIRLTEVTNILTITNSMFFMNNFKSLYDFETIPKRFVHGQEDRLVKDNFYDEIAIIIKGKSSKELTFITGCAHAGILSMISQVNSKFNSTVTRVIGGAHLNNASEERLQKTAEELVKLGVKETYFCHCSGNKISKIIEETTSINAHIVSTGDIIQL